MIYICIRQTTNWQDESTFLAQLTPHFKYQVDLWNSTFNIPYHIFRHRLRQIAELNIAKVHNSVVAAWNDIPEGALVAPVDDDDWFAPDLATILKQERHKNMTGYYWTSSFIEVPINFGHQLHILKRAILKSPPKWICTTNNYAIIKNSEMEGIFQSHTKASNWFWSHEGDVKKINMCLSVMNRTLASQTSLDFQKNSISRAKLVRKFLQYKRLYKKPIANELNWCKPYKDMMASLMEELKET